MPAKPNFVPYWTTGQSSAVAMPPQSLRNSGFSAGEPVAAQHFNQLLYELGQYIAYLDQATGSSVLAATLDSSLRLLGGGTLSYQATGTTWSWSQPLILSLPSIPDSQNTIAPGAIVVPAGAVAYVQANVPFSTTADVTSGSTTVANLAYELPISIGEAVSGAGIPAGATVAQVIGTSVILSLPASATATQATITFVGTQTPSVQTAPVASFVPNSNTVIIARGLGSHLFVGANAAVTTLHDNERKTLLEPGYLQVVRVPAGQDLKVLQAIYVSRETSAGRTIGAAYPTDASAANGAARASCAGFIYTATASGQSAAVMTAGILPGFFSLLPGAIYWLDPITPGGITATQPTLSQTPYVVRIGQALDANTLLVRPEHPPEGIFASLATPQASIGALTGATATLTGSVSSALYTNANQSFSVSAVGLVTAAGGYVSGRGFRDTFGPAMLGSSSAPNSNTTPTPMLDGTGRTFYAIPTRAGSLVAMSVYISANSGTAVSLVLQRDTGIVPGAQLYVLGPTLITNTGTPTRQILTATASFAKGQYPVAAGDMLYLALTSNDPQTSVPITRAIAYATFETDC